ncbi:recombinase family protein [Hymenobacter sp. BT683]|uniref:Recombinase family protein n=1 Tax=Hymenobacter jeongseonensis TaxID=2791027 RepID=A0ABS0IM93_9BACT|nr:recombinase family protein [Hymenobacter jeongseonensis]MBF9239482.1 recombinase family protein [Hymenobacter jeongseonensis]
MTHADPLPVALFARVSKEAQDFGRQLLDTQRHADRSGYEVVATIAEKLSGSRRSRAKRPDLDQLLHLAKSGRIRMVLVTELSRLGRRARETRAVVEELADLGVSVFALNIQLGYLLPDGKVNPMARLVMTVLMEVDEMETERMGHRIKSGQAAAFAAGAQKGRPAGSTKSSAQTISKYPKVVEHLQKRLSVRDVAKLANCSTNTVQKVKTALEAAATAALSS